MSTTPPAAGNSSPACKWKDWIDAIQAVVATIGIIVAGLWTYMVFIKDRENKPEANIEEKIKSVRLTSEVNYLQLALTVRNSGHELMKVSKVVIYIEQVLPIMGCAMDPCAARELNGALGSTEQLADRFDWPLIASRSSTVDWSIEPGESEPEDFEFALPSSLETARVYVWVRNDELSTPTQDVGWHLATIYRFAEEQHGRDEK